jgi:hypothetical protein
MKHLIKKLYRWKYGCRGGLRPPAGFGPFANPSIAEQIAYQYRRACWRLESRIYDWTGLPQEWDEYRDMAFSA